MPFQVFIATSKDAYRKPGTGCWELIERLNDGVAIDKAASVFVGDSAGRATDRKGGSADRDFASAVGVPFFTETQYFMGESE